MVLLFLPGLPSMDTRLLQGKPRTDHTPCGGLWEKMPCVCLIAMYQEAKNPVSVPPCLSTPFYTHQLTC